jgi:ribosomal-protein-alanine N-acetyltransferase
LTRSWFNVYLPTTRNDNYPSNHIQNSLIQGKTVRLRPFSVNDIEFLLRWNNDLEYSGEYEPFEPVSRKELEEWLPKEKAGQLWYIIETIEGEKVGQVVGRDQEDDSTQIGYRVIPSVRRRRYCTEAVALLIGHIFNLGTERITAEANPRNIPSRRVLEKLGFKQIEYKEKALELNCIWLDGIVYELRRGDLGVF